LNEISDGSLLLLVVILFFNAPNYHLSLVLASVVQGDADTCNTSFKRTRIIWKFQQPWSNLG